MTHKKLSPLLATFIQAMNTHDSNLLSSCFDDNAIVYDEGEEIKGLTPIKQWADNVFNKYELTAKVTDTTQSDNETILTTLVSGTFPGSPLEIKYYITFNKGKIAKFTSQ